MTPEDLVSRLELLSADEEDGRWRYQVKSPKSGATYTILLWNDLDRLYQEHSPYWHAQAEPPEGGILKPARGTPSGRVTDRDQALTEALEDICAHEKEDRQ